MKIDKLVGIVFLAQLNLQQACEKTDDLLICAHSNWEKVVDLLEGADSVVQEKVHVGQEPMLSLDGSFCRWLLQLCFSLGEGIICPGVSTCSLVAPFAECVPRYSLW